MNEGHSIRATVKLQVHRFAPDPAGPVTLPDGTTGRYELIAERENHNLITTAGRDFLTQQLYSAAPQASGAVYVGVTTDSTPPTEDDTVLADEITTGGLERSLASLIEHTTGTTVTVLRHTYTASADHLSVQKLGLFTASTGGTMVHTAAVDSVDIPVFGQLSVEWTITHD